MIEETSGDKGDTGATGAKGDTGEPGYTPQKGVDYFTQADIEEVREGMQEEITSTNKLSSDLVDDTNKSHKFVSQNDKNHWYNRTAAATSSTLGTIKAKSDYALEMVDGDSLAASNLDSTAYASADNKAFIGKGTLGTVLTDYVKNTDYANSSVAGVFKPTPGYNLEISSSNGILYCLTNTYSNYLGKSNSCFISKGTLENVLAEKIGNIETILETLDVGTGV